MSFIIESIEPLIPFYVRVRARFTLKSGKEVYAPDGFGVELPEGSTPQTLLDGIIAHEAAEEAANAEPAPLPDTFAALVGTGG